MKDPEIKWRALKIYALKDMKQTLWNYELYWLLIVKEVELLKRGNMHEGNATVKITF